MASRGASVPEHLVAICKPDGGLAIKAVYIYLSISFYIIPTEQVEALTMEIGFLFAVSTFSLPESLDTSCHCEARGTMV